MILLDLLMLPVIIVRWIRNWLQRVGSSGWPLIQGTINAARAVVQQEGGHKAQLLYTFHSANSRGQFWTQQAGIGGFVCDPAHGGKLLVDRIGCQPTGFEVHAITSDHDPVEGEPRFRAVPCYELVESEFVDAARTETVEHCQLGMIEVSQPERSATIIRLEFLLPIAAASRAAALGI